MKTFFSFLWKVVFVAALGFIVVRGRRLSDFIKKFYIKLFKREESRNGNEKPKTKAPASPTAKEEISSQDLFARKCELEQQMAKVVSGKTGMLMLLDTIQNDPSVKEKDDSCRQNYREKQNKLNKYMREYRALLEQVSELPEEERQRFVPVKYMSQYQKLLDTEV